MKILMTTDTVGGVWTYALQLAEALADQQVEIALATAGGSMSASQRAAVARLSHVTVYPGTYRLEWMQDPWEDVRAAGLKLLRIAEDFQPDIVHLNDYSHGALEWPAPVLVVGHSCVLSWHAAVRREPAGNEWETYRQRVRAGLQNADIVAAPTAAMLAALQEFYGPLPRTCVISNGRSLKRSGGACEPVSPSQKEPFVLTAGRIWDEAKNVGVLSEAAGAVRWPICVAGATDHPDGHVPSLDGLQLLGQLPPEQMMSRFRRAAVYAHPARYEPFGLAPLEAAQNGCALVLSDIPTLREIWGPAAFYVSPDDPSGWGQMLNQLINEPALRKLYAERARYRASQMTAEQMAAGYFELYQSMLRQPASPATVSAMSG